MEENNFIAICFPMGSGGHIAGRLLASCDNVSWYDHCQNGNNPWDLFDTTYDNNFSKLHFNKRFKGAVGKGVCKLTVPPVLDMAEKQGIEYNKESITSWKSKVFPNNLIYTLSADLDNAKDFFNPAKYFLIIPNDVEMLIDRWLASTAHYYVNPKEKSFTYKDLYTQKSKLMNTDMRNILKQDMIALISNYKKYSSNNDVIVNEVSELYNVNIFKNICNKLELNFNLQNYQKTLDVILKYSHL